jgi:TPR repeat protein
MYGIGQGVIQDDVMAHMYFNVAAVSGNKDAAKNRGVMAKRIPHHK